jgi:hypothetical protein
MFIQDVQPSYDVPVIAKKTAKTVYLNTFVRESFFDGYDRFSSIKVFKEVIVKKSNGRLKRTWVEVESIGLYQNGSSSHQLSMPRKTGRYKVIAIGSEGRGNANLQWLKITKKKKNVVFLDEQGYNIPKPKVKKSKKKSKKKKK